jgi:hypothetical protein
MFVVCRWRVGEVFRQGNIIASRLTFRRSRESFCEIFRAKPQESLARQTGSGCKIWRLLLRSQIAQALSHVILHLGTLKRLTLLLGIFPALDLSSGAEQSCLLGL